MAEPDSINSAVVYKSLDFLGLPDHRIGSDASVWSRRTKGRIPKQGSWHKIAESRHEGGYSMYLFRYHRKITAISVHRLLLLEFVGPCPDGMEACHNDGNPQNNSLNNLRWDTHSANMKDAVRHGTHRPSSLRGSQNPFSRLTESKVREIRRLHVPHSQTRGIAYLAKMFGVSIGCITKVLYRYTWRHVD